ncbi:hypothetical protein BDR26DRAFT_1009206 [Obelidium mucronatum]|nr:hypothetical protein BDR26DRAFT_1009206 [Obelidium mucronatum]
MTHKGTDWNRHHGVGETLLENWVEERAVSDKILEERKQFAGVSKRGHKDILIHDPNLREISTTSKLAFAISASRSDPNKIERGKRRQLVEAELMKRAVQESMEPPVDRSAKEWISTNHNDFSTQAPLCTLGVQPPPLDKTAKYSHPITFWSDHATKGCGTVICSTSFTGKEEQINSETGIQFGKHAAFSTPIKEFNKGAVKE